LRSPSCRQARQPTCARAPKARQLRPRAQEQGSTPLLVSPPSKTSKLEARTPAPREPFTLPHLPQSDRGEATCLATRTSSSRNGAKDGKGRARAKKAVTYSLALFAVALRRVFTLL